jgi:hypothetical protein
MSAHPNRSRQASEPQIALGPRAFRIFAEEFLSSNDRMIAASRECIDTSRDLIRRLGTSHATRERDGGVRLKKPDAG